MQARRRHRRYRGSVVFAFALAVSLVGRPVAAGTSSPDSGAERTAGDVIQLGEEGGVLGVYFDRVTGEVIVLSPADGPMLSTAALFGYETPLRVKRSQNIRRGDLETIKHEMAAAVLGGTLRPDPWAVYLDPVADTIVVEGLERGLLDVVLGDSSAKVTFRPVESSPRLAGRLNDTEPFYGGGRGLGSGAGCSLGFAVEFLGHLNGAMLTAGHCWPVGFSPWTPQGLTLGTVGGRENPRSTQPSHDSEYLVGKRYSGRVWVGLDTGAWLAVAGASDASVGFSYCMDGAKTLEHCGVVADAVNIAKFFPEDNVWVNDLVRVYPHTIDTGDSGGPFYRKPGDGYVYARGTIVGQDPVENKDYAQMWSWIANRWAVRICTVFDC